MAKSRKVDSKYNAAGKILLQDKFLKNNLIVVVTAIQNCHFHYFNTEKECCDRCQNIPTYWLLKKSHDSHSFHMYLQVTSRKFTKSSFEYDLGSLTQVHIKGGNLIHNYISCKHWESIVTQKIVYAKNAFFSTTCCIIKVKWAFLAALKMYSIYSLIQLHPSGNPLISKIYGEIFSWKIS